MHIWLRHLRIFKRPPLCVEASDCRYPYPNRFRNRKRQHFTLVCSILPIPRVKSICLTPSSIMLGLLKHISSALFQVSQCFYYQTAWSTNDKRHATKFTIWVWRLSKFGWYLVSWSSKWFVHRDTVGYLLSFLSLVNQKFNILHPGSELRRNTSQMGFPSSCWSRTNHISGFGVNQSLLEWYAVD